MKANFLKSSLLGAALVAALAFAACGGGDDDTNGNGNGATVDPNVTAVPADATEFVISMQDNFYEPKDFTIAKGQTVTFVAKNEGTAIHNLSVLETDFKSDAIVQPGTESRFDVTFTETGEYDYQCDYHLPDMVGTITVK